MALTQKRAEARTQVIKKGSIIYDFHISLQKDNYSGLSEITFELISVPEELVIDFKGTKVTRLVINSKLVEAKIVDGFIYLDTTILRVGKNEVFVGYDTGYDNDGSGCVSFIDVDTKQYIYTQFQPYYANRVFACFDQPDLKAKMRLNVISPSEWKKVLSNEYAIVEKSLNSQEYIKNTRTSSQQQINIFLNGKSGNMTIFPQTKLLPTYLYCFVAGQYLQLKLQEEKVYNNIPMSLYCIESLYQHLKVLAPFVFQITIQSMKHFQSFFGYKYAFNKYDQVFAHQYKWGAMQNAGIVTFNDLYVFKQKVSTERLLSFANTISHELAHHWFGNLVTMRWWDDLWLNESFADFISHFCLQKIKHNCKTINYQSSMASFLQRKGWGYHEDQMITTHPIRGEIENTSVAQSIFDGITYSKGAATMKQLLFLMKEQNFSKALAQYFHKYEWSNATIQDFLAEMQHFFTIKEFTLTQWRQLWLEKASLNLIEAVWNPQDNSDQAKLTVKQSVHTPEHPTLRLHKIKVGLFTENLEIDVLQVLVLPQSQTVVTYNGSKGYKAVLLNYEDQTFVKNIIDPISLQFFIKNINGVKDLLSRTLIWRSFFDMVKDAKMTSTKFVDVITTSLAEQSSDSIFEKQFDFVHSAINVYTPKKFRSQLNSRMFKFIYQLINKVPADQQNRIVILKSKLISFAYSEEEIKTLISWKKKTEPQLQAHDMTVGHKWSTVVKAFTLSCFTNQQKEALFEQQRVEDPSDTAKNKRYTCDSLKSTEQQFEKIYESLKTKDCKHSVSLKNHIIAGWNHHAHSERLQKYRSRYFADIPQLLEALQGDHYQVFYQGLQPIDDDLAHHIQEYQKLTFPPGQQKHARAILKIIDDLKRRLKAYQLYGNANL